MSDVIAVVIPRATHSQLITIAKMLGKTIPQTIIFLTHAFLDSAMNENGNGNKPHILILGDDVIAINCYRDILVETANWLIRQGKLTKCPIKIKRGKNYIINKEPKHRDGRDFYAPKKLEKGFWMYTNYNKENCIKYAKKLLQKYGFSSDFLRYE